MENFLKRGSSQQSQRKEASPPKKKNIFSTSKDKSNTVKEKQDFLTTATADRQDKNKDIGKDIIGDLKDNITNVKAYFDLIKELDNIKGEIQQISFATKFPMKEYRLIELDKKLADEFEKGQRLVFRGESDDFVVLCSQNRTFSAKEVETSNSMLLLPSLHTSKDVADPAEPELTNKTVAAVSHHYLELKEIECISVFRLRDLLRENELSWEWEKEEQKELDLYTRQKLLNTVQMSEGQLDEALAKMPVVTHKNYIRWLSHDTRERMVSLIVDLCDNDEFPSVSIESVDFTSLRNNLPDNVTDSMIDWFLRVMCERSDDGKDYKMIYREMVRARATLVSRISTRFDGDSFQLYMDQLLPTGMEFKMLDQFNLLDGLCLLEKDNRKGGHVVIYLNIEDLPEDPRLRLKLLFDQKPTWSMAEISSFLTDICPNAMTMNGLMVSHCRSVKNDKGEKVFCGLKAI